MLKIFLLSWAVLANALGAHTIATTIEKPYIGPQAVKSEMVPIDSLISELPLIKPSPTLNNPGALSIQADAWLVRDSASGAVLAEKNGYTKRPPASTIKPMTALLTLEKINPDKIITISSEAASQPGSSAGLRAGEQVTVGTVLYGLLLNSGNDAASALAQIPELYGGKDRFVQAMNDRAKSIGLSETHFSGPDGYDEQGTYSTAFDITKLLDYALRHEPRLSQIMLTKDYEYRDTNRHSLRLLHNSDRFVQFDYAGVLGGKTGTGSHRSLGGAGHTMVTCAERDSHRLCAFVGGTLSVQPSASYDEAKKLLDFAFANTNWH